MTVSGDKVFPEVILREREQKYCTKCFFSKFGLFRASLCASSSEESLCSAHAVFSKQLQWPVTWLFTYMFTLIELIFDAVKASCSQVRGMGMRTVACVPDVSVSSYLPLSLPPAMWGERVYVWCCVFVRRLRHSHVMGSQSCCKHTCLSFTFNKSFKWTHDTFVWHYPFAIFFLLHERLNTAFYFKKFDNHNCVFKAVRASYLRGSSDWKHDCIHL